jgi:A/G-specific adenine glycosylase
MGKTMKSASTSARGTRERGAAALPGKARKTLAASASKAPRTAAVLDDASAAKAGKGAAKARRRTKGEGAEAALRDSPLLAPGAVSTPLLNWYDRHRRVLPWRALPGETADPYKVWLSEIMLQQTTVAAVGPYFQAFIARWPTVADLAASPIEDLLAAWAGLGYYARARNLHKCAQAVVRDHGGIFPDTEEGLRELPGIGGYTAGAIAAIAFNRKASAPDGNVERVVARLFAVTTPLPNAKPELRALAAELVPDDRPGDFAQAMMDLGATLCAPRKPACVLCPLNDRCEARKQNIAAALPARAAKKPRPLRRAVAFWIERESANGEIEVMLRRRPHHGLLGGMLEIPVTDWKRDASADDESTLAQSPLASVKGAAKCNSAKHWRTLPGIVRHGFTHFELETTVMATRLPKGAASPPDAIWTLRDRLDVAGLPTVMWKVVKRVAERCL